MRLTLLFVGLLFVVHGLHAQDGKTTTTTTAQTAPAVPPSLPAMLIAAEQAHSILKWYCQYDGVKSIAIQRSVDSVRNFTTIGVINAPKKGNGTYTDLHPLVGKNYYRLSVEFGGDLEWFSNIYNTKFDSATIAKALEVKVVPPAPKPIIQPTVTKPVTPVTTQTKDTTTATPAAAAITAPLPSKKERRKARAQTNKVTSDSIAENTSAVPVNNEPKPFTFTPSSKIYTNPYTGHISIHLDDYQAHRYTIRFYDPAKNEVLRIARISKATLILDKNNFNSRGIYSFELFDGANLVESGYVSIY